MMFLVRTPDGKRYAKVSVSNLGNIPKYWKIYKDRGNPSYYNFKSPTRLNKRFEGVKELKTEKDFKDYYKPMMAIKLLFGKVSSNV